MRVTTRLIVGAIASLFFAAGVARGADPAPLGAPNFKPSLARPFGWRGDGSGQFPAATPAIAWSETNNVRWSVVVGRSYSSPILTEKFAFATSEPSRLVCVDRATGQIAWKLDTTPADLADEKSRTTAAAYEAPKDGSGMAAATPLTDGVNVYVVFANGIVRAVGLDGKPKWTAFIDADQNTGYGRSASPIMVGGKLIVHMTNLYAFDPATGKELWRNTDALSTYGTPAGQTINGVEVIVTPGGDVVRAADGKGLDDSIGKAGHTTPLIDGNVVYYAENMVSAVQLTPAFKDKELWNSLIADDGFSSPLLIDGTLFTATGKGQLLAYDAHGKGSQESLIADRWLFGKPDNNAGPVSYASLTLGGKYLFLNSNKGEMVVLEATREAKEVGRNQLPGTFGSTPVFSGKDMFVRNGDKLFCIGE